MEKPSGDKSVINKVDKILFPKPIRILYQLRLYGLIVSLLLLTAWWLFRVYPIAFFALAILILASVWFIKRRINRPKKIPYWQIGKEEMERQKQLVDDQLWQKAYKLVTLLGLDSQITLNDLKNKIKANIRRDYKDDPITEHLMWTQLFYQLRDLKSAFFIDWKWGTPEILCRENLSEIIPDFSYHFTKHELIEEPGRHRFALEGEIMGERISTEIYSGTPSDFLLEILNPILEKKIDKKLALYDMRGDSTGFVLVPVKTFEEATSDEYWPFWGGYPKSFFNQ